MELSVNTPALLFPCISLLLLAYTNRFLAIATLIRGLKTKYASAHEPGLIKQIINLRKRVIIIRNMQGCCCIKFVALCNVYVSDICRLSKLCSNYIRVQLNLNACFAGAFNFRNYNFCKCLKN
jgi:hypothetical protein